MGFKKILILLMTFVPNPLLAKEGQLAIVSSNKAMNSVPNQKIEVNNRLAIVTGYEQFILDVSETEKILAPGLGLGVRFSPNDSFAMDAMVRQGIGTKDKTTTIFYALDFGLRYSILGGSLGQKREIIHDGRNIFTSVKNKKSNLSATMGVTEYFFNDEDRSFMFFGGYVTIQFEYLFSRRWGTELGAGADSASNGGSSMIPLRAFLRFNYYP